MEAISTIPDGDLIDVGCGPGMFLRRLLDERPGDFRIAAIDLSPGMIDEAVQQASGTDVRFEVGRADALPFPDTSFDVVVAMGVLEYCDIRATVQEFVRVLRPGGVVVATMLNPLSPYRLFEWCCFWPLLRLLGRVGSGWRGRLGTAYLLTAHRATAAG